MTIIVENKSFVFYHIPKTGGMSIKNWFMKNVKDSEIHNTHFCHATPEMLLKIYREPIRISSCIVRNPWDRTVSFYHYSLKHKHIDRSISFYDFIMNRDKIRVNSKIFIDFFNNPKQSDYLKQVNITHILRFENLEEDFKKIQNIFSCYKPLQKINSTKHRPYLEYYTEKTFEEVAHIFKEDIINLNYDKLI
jgi:hypothetical protein